MDMAPVLTVLQGRFGSWTQSSNGDDVLYGDCLQLLMSLSLSLGLLSTMATSLAFYWFAKMRRSFRHDLIMLLIQSDFIKSLWFVIFPIVTYTRGPVASDSAFCQVSGFFFSVGIEASDVAVVLIALQSAMYIYRPRSGLHPYRWLAYAAYVILPLLFASLAFLDDRGYRNVGAFCWLPHDRGWARLALSWVPRYIIFAIILVTYVFIYLYVRRMILRYERRDSAVHPGPLWDTPPGQQLQCATPVTCHELLCSTVSSGRPSWVGYTGRLRSISFASSTFSRDGTAGSPMTTAEAAILPWKHPRLKATPCPASGTVTSDEQGPQPETETGPDPDLRLPPPTIPAPQRRSSSAAGVDAAAAAAAAPVPSADCSTDGPHPHPPRPTMPAATCRVSASSSSSSTSSHHHCPYHNANPYHALASSHVSRNRDKVRRQLRALFVYPLLYVATWVFPLVNHALDYSATTVAAAGRRPAWVPVLGLVSLAVQGAADCAVFTAREKPWRHTGRDGFWAAARRVWWAGGTGRRAGVGRTREEMLVDGRLARSRRAGEMLDEMGEKRGGRAGGDEGASRYWWDDDEFGAAVDGEV